MRISDWSSDVCSSDLGDRWSTRIHHCERSEAIQSGLRHSGLLRFARNDEVSPMAEILFLVHRAPWPPDRGDRIRSWHMFEALAKLAPVHLAALADNPADAAASREKMAPLCTTLRSEIRTVSRPIEIGRAHV